MKLFCTVLPICLIAAGLFCPGCKPSATAGLEENKALVRRMIEAMNNQDWATFTELHTPDFVCHWPGESKPQPLEEFVQFFREFCTSFPDFHQTIEDIIAEGDKVVIRETGRGTNKGDIEELGVTTTGKEVTWTLILIFRIADGKVAESWVEYDSMGFMQQLGVIPSARPSVE
jgi:C-1 hydroxylase